MDKEFFFPSSHLKPEHLEEPTTLTIARLESQEFYDQKTKAQQPKPVLVFTNQQYKPMILNVTNWEMLELLYGEDTDCWKSQRIVVQVEKVHSPNGMVDALRILQQTPPKSDREVWEAFKREHGVNDVEVEAILGTKLVSRWMADSHFGIGQAMTKILQAREQQDVELDAHLDGQESELPYFGDSEELPA